MPHFWIRVYGGRPTGAQPTATATAAASRRPWPTLVDEGEEDLPSAPNVGDQITFRHRNCTVLEVDPPPPLDGTVHCVSA